MPLGEQGDDQSGDGRFLANDALGDLASHLSELSPKLLHAGGLAVLLRLLLLRRSLLSLRILSLLLRMLGVLRRCGMLLDSRLLVLRSLLLLGGTRPAGLLLLLADKRIRVRRHRLVRCLLVSLVRLLR
ncbi:hypothetical protein GCM10011313_25220 [Mycetocola zhadangensis]|nr:hypothetical protein GCM10011313_25220 [Mycetocola zhadangensis]